MNSELAYEILICVVASFGAGIGTGFAGLSAAVFISPMLVAFLDVPVYEAVGVALASDVLASAVSAYTYGKKGNIDLKHGRLLMVSVLIFAVVGSIAAYFVSASDTGNTVLGYWAILGSIALGFKFLIFPTGTEKKEKKKSSKRYRLAVFGCGVYIGSVCGFQGTGGGMLLLLVLTSVMSFEFKSAVGTSVFIMAFTALIGAVTHFIAYGMPDRLLLVLCIVLTVIFARLGAWIANRISVRKLNLITGTLLTIAGVVMLLAKLFL